MHWDGARTVSFLGNPACMYCPDQIIGPVHDAKGWAKMLIDTPHGVT